MINDMYVTHNKNKLPEQFKKNFAKYNTTSNEVIKSSHTLSVTATFRPVIRRIGACRWSGGETWEDWSFAEEINQISANWRKRRRRYRH